MKAWRLRVILETAGVRRPGSVSSSSTDASQLELIQGFQLLRLGRSPNPIHQKSSRWSAGVSTRRSTSARIRFRSSRSEEHTSELQSRFGIAYAVFFLK